MDMDRRLLLGSLSILFIIALGYSTFDSYLVQYITVSDVLANPTNEDVRILGKLSGTPVIEGDTYRFQITDGSSTLDVMYRGNLPASFSIDSDVVVQGRMDENNVFLAVMVLTRCPSKFEG